MAFMPSTVVKSSPRATSVVLCPPSTVSTRDRFLSSISNGQGSYKQGLRSMHYDHLDNTVSCSQFEAWLVGHVTTQHSVEVCRKD